MKNIVIVIITFYIIIICISLNCMINFRDLSTENLKYLTSQQALADIANFIVAMNEKNQFPSDIKWIAFGGSYPGSLAAWLRAKYPHLVSGSMSASGPLLAKLDFNGTLLKYKYAWWYCMIQ